MIRPGPSRPRCVLRSAPPGVHTAIVGTTKPEHWRKNVQYAAAGPLDPLQFDSIRNRCKQVARSDWAGQE